MVRIRLKEKAHEKVDEVGGWLMPAAMGEGVANDLVRTLWRAGGGEDEGVSGPRNGDSR